MPFWTFHDPDAVSYTHLSDKKVLRLGTDAAFPPFEFQEGNDFMGIDIDIGRAVADELGMDFEVVNMDFDSLLGALESGKVDLVAAGMTVRPDREKQADFSDTYYQATQVITVMKDNAEIKGVDDLKNKKIGVQKGTTGEELAREIEGAEVLSFANGQEAVSYTHLSRARWRRLSTATSATATPCWR